jgi:signal transduction histidine kinase
VPKSRVDSWRQWVLPELLTVERRLDALHAELDVLPVADSQPDFTSAGYRSFPAAMPETEKWVQVDLGRVLRVEDIVLVPAVLPSVVGSSMALGFPVRFRVEVSLAEDFAEKQMIADYTKADFPDPGSMPVVLPKVATEARFVRVTASVLSGEPDNYFLALGELVVCSGNRNVAQHSEVQALDVLDSPRWNPSALVDGISVVGNPVERRSMPTNGYHGAVEDRADAVQWVQVDLGTSLPLDELRLVPARPVDFPDTIGFGFPTRFKVEAAEDATFSSPVVIADHTAADYPNPGDRRVILGARGLSGRYVRMTAVQLWQRARLGSHYVFALSEMEALCRGVNVAREKAVTESSPLNEASSRWAPAYLVDGITPREGVGTFAEWLSAVARRQAINLEIKLLEKEAAALHRAAEARLAWLAGIITAALVVAGVAFVWIGRIRQRRQTQRLRGQIARDLHDEIGSNLSSIGILSQLGMDAAPDADSMRHDLEEIRRVSTETADSMHDIVWLISPGIKTAGDLAGRLRATAALLLAGIEWTMQVDGLEGENGLTMEAQRDFFLIFKEALHNNRRHSAARNVTISLTQSARKLALRIADDGKGYDPATVQRGQGLRNMERRAAACVGRLQMDSSPQNGTVLTLTIPLKK